MGNVLEELKPNASKVARWIDVDVLSSRMSKENL